MTIDSPSTQMHRQAESRASCRGSPLFWTRLALALTLLGMGHCLAATGPALRIGVAQVMPFHDLRTLSKWANYLGRKLDRPVHFVHRRSHTEIVDLLMQGRLDVAWICPDHYLRHQERVGMIAGPMAQGRQDFQLLMLAPARGMPDLQGLLDLHGKVIAFAEPDTNLGSAVVERALVRLGAEPQGFFRRVIYTGDHARVIRAVGDGIAHAGAVMDQSWAAVQASDPRLAKGLRVIWRSGWRPLPPLVGAPALSGDSASALRMALTEMQDDGEGRALLSALGFERFVIPDPEHYRAGAETTESAACAE